MGAHGVNLPSRYFTTAIFAESPEQIAEATTIYNGGYSYNQFAGKNSLPAIRGVCAFIGRPPYPTFNNTIGDIFVLQQRFKGEVETLPALAIGTVATIRDYSVVNIPTNTNFPRANYKERVVRKQETTELAIGKAIFGYINGERSEVDTSFLALLIRQVAEEGRARRAMRPVRNR